MNNIYEENIEALFHQLSSYMAEEYVEVLKTITPAMPTGLTNLDQMMCGGLRPGLYTLFGLNNIGKNTLLMQMTESLAAQNIASVIINTEDSLEHLTPQFFARQTFRNDPQTAIPQCCISDERLESPQRFKLLEEQLYSIASRIAVIEDNEINPNNIEKVIDFQLNRHDKLVFLINSNEFSSLSKDRESMLIKLRELKRLAHNYQLPIIITYTLNLQDYIFLTEGKSVIDDVEQLTDVSLLLQPNRFDALLKDPQYRLPLYNPSSEDNARLYELFIRKQSYGKQKQCAYLTFYPQFGFFQEG